MNDLKKALPDDEAIAAIRSGLTERGINGVTVEGVAAHGAFPAGGRNAIALLCDVLADMDMGSAASALRFVREKLNVKDWDGKKLGIDFADEPSGELTVNLGIVRADELSDGDD